MGYGVCGVQCGVQCGGGVGCEVWGVGCDSQACPVC